MKLEDKLNLKSKIEQVIELQKVQESYMQTSNQHNFSKHNLSENDVQSIKDDNSHSQSKSNKVPHFKRGSSRSGSSNQI